MRVSKLFLSISSLFAVANSVLGSTNENKAAPSSDTFELFENYGEPKNIMFSAMIGGSSHVLWALSILEELSSRGHSTFFVTRDDYIKFGNNYPFVAVQSIGPAGSAFIKEAVQDLRDLNFSRGLKHLLAQMTDTFAEEYTKVRDFIDSHDIDITICDALNSPCVEASITAGIPFIVTSSLPQGKDASAPYINNDMINMRNPTTEFMSLKERLHNMIIKPAQLVFNLKGSFARHDQVLMSLGITPAMQPHEKWANSIKIVNSAFGFEQGRPLGPLVEFIGPIVPKLHLGLTPDIKQFLDTHKFVAYVAFGQNAWPTEEDGTLIMTALLDALEGGDIDGIIWSTRSAKEIFPAYITTSSNTTYDIQSFYNFDENRKNNEVPVLISEWVPQVAILNHPSTSIFITHGGAGSLHEAMYAGVRVVVFPFFGDQHAAAITATKNGIGLKLDCKKSQQNANEVIRRVARDENGQFQASVNRFKALVQIRSKAGVTRGADIVEEVLFTHVESGKIPHRYDVARNMSFIKANNLDIYALLLGLTVLLGYGAWSLVSYLIRLSPSSTKYTSVISHEKKLKSL